MVALDITNHAWQSLSGNLCPPKEVDIMIAPRTYTAIIHDEINDEVYEEQVTLGPDESESTLAEGYEDNGQILLLLREAV